MNNKMKATSMFIGYEMKGDKRAVFDGTIKDSNCWTRMFGTR